jgi:hypothetical protein
MRQDSRNLILISASSFWRWCDTGLLTAWLAAMEAVEGAKELKFEGGEGGCRCRRRCNRSPALEGCLGRCRTDEGKRRGGEVHGSVPATCRVDGGLAGSGYEGSTKGAVVAEGVEEKITSIY